MTTRRALGGADECRSATTTPGSGEKWSDWGGTDEWILAGGGGEE